MVDMHIHTKNSDGEYETSEIIKMLKQKSINTFSITDHDNIDSCKEMENIELPKKMKYIPGVEFSGKTDKYQCHILGYNINYTNKQIIEECNKIKKRKVEKIKQIIKYIRQEYGINITEQEEQQILNTKGTIGRLDICKLLIIKGYGEKPQIYDKYLTNIKDMQDHRSKIETITEIIKQSGGKAVLAHPLKIEKKYNRNIEDIIEEFLEKGIEGIEVYNSVHTLEDVKRYLLLAKKYNLLITGGSDFHGSTHPERVLGYTTKQKIKINSSNLKLY